MNTRTYSIAKTYSRTPGPRYEKEGSYSGEKFRREYFYPALLDAVKDNSVLNVDLDGTFGYGASFLEETFGGLIRHRQLDYDTIVRHIQLKSEEEDYLIEDIMEYLKQAKEACEKV